MGIKGIKKLINNYQEILDLKDVTSLVIDASLFMYKAKNAQKTYGIKFLNYFKNQIKLLNKNDIIAVYIFDGPSSELKEHTKQKRKESQNVVRVVSEDVEELKKYLAGENIEFIVSEEEADSKCVQVMIERDCDGILSEDTDILCYGGVLLTGYKSTSNKLIKYDINKIIKELEISLYEYVKMCIMCGCDYTNGIRGISSIKGYKLIKNGVTDEYLETNIENYKEILNIFKIDSVKKLN